MQHDSSHMKEFQEILDGGAFDLLAAYTDESCWQAMTNEEREMLAYLFVRLGEKQLSERVGDVAASFTFALKAAPESANIYYFQAEALLNHARGVPDLLHACDVIEKASALSSDAFDIWYVWAVILSRLGSMTEDFLYLQDSLLKFTHAEKYTSAFTPEKLASFYFDWGISWFFIGKLSGEAGDFKQALDLYKIAAKQNFEHPHFWVAYGDAMVELAFLIGKTELFYEAVDFYTRAVKLDSTLFQGWLNLGCAYQMVFELSGDEIFYHKGVDCFKQIEVTPLGAKSAILWLKWGKLMSLFAKAKNDSKLLEESLEKFAAADAIEPNQAMILNRWGETEMILGSGTERFDLLRAAEKKIARSVALDPEVAEGWYLYGICLNELGKYFNDSSFYEQAIEKFQMGIDRDDTDPLLWFGLAASHYVLGDTLNDRFFIEKAIKYYARVSELGGIPTSQLWNDWAVALMRLAEVTNEQSYLEDALSHFERFISLDDEEGLRGAELEWLYNYGCALDFFGDFTECESHYEKAIQVLNYVIQQDADYYHARYNLALACSHLGESVSDLDCLQTASDHFEVLLRSDPEDEIAWCDWGLVQMHQAELSHEPIRPEQSLQMYAAAEDKFLHAAALGSTGAYYHLGCLSALMENYPRAMAFLERAQSMDSLPPADDLLHDEWLEGLRETDAFRSFLSQITSEQEKK